MALFYNGAVWIDTETGKVADPQPTKSVSSEATSAAEEAKAPPAFGGGTKAFVTCLPS